jgi:hypothetical protein
MSTLAALYIYISTDIPRHVQWVLPMTDQPPARSYAGFLERVFFDALDRNLRSGLPMKVIMNGEVVPEERARQIVAYARRNGFAAADPAPSPAPPERE